MYGKRKSVLLALVFMAMLIIPAGLVGAGVNIEANTGSDEMIVETDHSDDAGNVNGKAIAKDGATIKKIDGKEAMSVLGDDFQLPDRRNEAIGMKVVNSDRDNDLNNKISGLDIDLKGIEPRVPKSMMVDLNSQREHQI